MLLAHAHACDRANDDANDHSNAGADLILI